MNLPYPGDFIDIHNHGARSKPGVFTVETIMAHEERSPDDEAGLVYTTGIHPWFLTSETLEHQLGVLRDHANHNNIIAIGEAGFDKLRGPSLELQRYAFEAQVKIADRSFKPLVIHCVRAWDELFAENKKLKPSTQWLIHGFRGKKELALQIIKKGMYLSFWIDFIMRPESAVLLKSLPEKRFFLETDGADVDIREVYEKVAADLEMTVNELKKIIFSNFREFFGVEC